MWKLKFLLWTTFVSGSEDLPKDIYQGKEHSKEHSGKGTFEYRNISNKGHFKGTNSKFIKPHNLWGLIIWAIRVHFGTVRPIKLNHLKSF